MHIVLNITNLQNKIYYTANNVIITVYVHCRNEICGRVFNNNRKKIIVANAKHVKYIRGSVKIHKT